jgi:Dolichyl-phosphate-mannose-protein mannosyltransferase
VEKLKSWTREYWIILLFTLTKLVLHLVTATNYGFQRDAYLYMAQAKHLAWGFFSTPPLVAFVTRIHTIIWGDSLLAVRLLPALVGAASLFMAGWLIKQLKGGVMAQLIGLTAIFLSPAFLRTSTLLQPVVFNHFFWLMTAFVVFQLVHKQNPKKLLWLIPVLGLGWMAKYSIIFYASSLLAALLLSPHRRLLWTKYLPWTLAGGVILILPNLFWQHAHNWPVLSHMSELKDTQLGNMQLKDFLFAQLFMHLPALPVWIGGLIWLIFNQRHRPYRLFAWAFVFTLLLVIQLQGKFYYTIAAYTILMVFGGIAWEHWASRPRRWIAWVVLALIVINGIYSLPLSLPVYKPEAMVEYGKKQVERGLGVMFMWEDGEIHDLPQDFADMVGWDELGQKVWIFYETLDDTIKEKTLIYGEFYGCAGAMDYYRPNSFNPEVFCFNDAYMEWIPRTPVMEHMIYVGYSDRIALYFDKVELVGRVEHPHFRERGLPIWFGSHPTSKLYEDWEETWLESKGRFTRGKNK